MPAIPSLIGKTFERLKVISHLPPAEKRGRIRRYVSCQCECGNKTIVQEYHLLSGHTKSCGCFQKERRTTHGMCGTKTYEVWQAMIQRCFNPNNTRFSDYGGRGICVCREWEKFENFLKDMGEAPAGLTLDRLDNNLGYSKSNCAWRTRKEQQRNMRSNRIYTVNGVTACFAVLCEHFNQPPNLVRQRMRREKWSVERAFLTPVHTDRPKEV